MIYGHVINLMMPLTLPWTFFMLKSGVRNFKDKINAACYIVLYFMAVFFPIFYLFELMQEKEK